jgi:phosphoglycerol transferase MdoB-like AlkP superfamily enzyme
MNSITKNLRTIAFQILILLALFTATRLFFFINNFAQFSELKFGQILIIFLAGIRFDLSAIGYIDGLLIILFFVPGNFKFTKTFRAVIGFVYICVNSLLILSNLADSEYFKFTKKRATVFIFDVLGFGNTMSDGLNLIPQFIHDFWYIVLIWLIFTTVLIWTYSRRKQIEKILNYNLKLFFTETAFFCIIVALTVLAARGGFQLKPVSTLGASEYAGQENSAFVLNTPFSIIKSIGKTRFEEKTYFSKQELQKIYSPIREYKSDKKFRKMNVVIIILESFSAEYVGALNHSKTYTPFLDSLIGKSLLFENAYADGTQSVEAVPSVISSIPSLSDTPFITSPYNSNKYLSLTQILKNEGWFTSFFHGGSRGTMGFDSYAKSTGTDSVYERPEYNNEKDYDGNWGIFDEHFLQFTARKYNTFPQPFFSYIFTLSSHHPYTVPEEYKNQFAEGDLPIEKAVEYADFSLKEFFETASKMPWYQNTLFVLSADHTGPAFGKFYKNPVGRFKIPIIFFSPSDTLLGGKKDSKTVSQIDIFPSVLDYLNYHKKFFSFGTSVFQNQNQNFAVNFLEGMYQTVSDGHILFFNGKNITGFYDIKKDSLLTQNLEKENSEQKNQCEKNIKAFIQTYNNRMIKDSLNIGKE